MTQRRVTIKQVAEAAGVSTTTVSHILNDVPGKRIREETRERVRDVASALGYAPNLLAQGLRTSRSNTIGFVGDEVITTPFAGKMILGAQGVANARGSVVLVVSTGREPLVENREIAELMRRQVDGILYASMYHRPVFLPEALQSVPTVVVNATCSNAEVPWVAPDEVAGGADAAGVLIEAGHRRIAFINDMDDVPAAVGREQGFRARAAAAGIDPSMVLVVRSESNPTGGYQAARDLLAARARPTGIFCFNDRMAMGVYRAATEANLRIPDDLSVVGFDNQDFVADGIHPGLTTIELPHFAMGAWASEQLFRQIDGAPAGEPSHLKLRGPVVNRHSVAASPRALLHEETQPMSVAAQPRPDR
jgi:LacI family transcriptional regulator